MTSRHSSLWSERKLLNRDSLTESGKWIYATDNTLKMMSLGFLCGGAISVIIFRSIAVRVATTAFGAGFGLGKSYVDTKYILGHDVEAESSWTARVAPAEKMEERI